MKRIRIFFLIFISLLFIFLLYSCAQKSGVARKTKIRFSYWASTADAYLIDELVNTFEKENPDIDIIQEMIPWAAYPQKMMVQFAANTAPDVIMTSSERASVFIEKQALIDLYPFINKDSEINIKDFYPDLVDRMSKDGKLYVLPRDIDLTNCVYYNKKIFDDEKTPYPKDDWNWDEFLDVCKKVTKDFNNDGKIDRYAITFYGFYNILIYSNGGMIVDNVKNPTRCTIDDEKCIEAMQFYKDLVFKYKVSPIPETIVSSLGIEEPDLFKAQKTAMFFAGIWMTPMFNQDIKDFDWDIVMFPKGPKGPRRFIAEGSGYSITKSSKNPELAWKLVKLLGGERGQKVLSKSGLAQPSIMSLANSPVFLTGGKPENKKIVVEGAKMGVFRPFTAKWDIIEENYLNPQMNLIMSPDPSNRIPVEKGLKDIAQKINKEVFEKTE